MVDQATGGVMRTGNRFRLMLYGKVVHAAYPNLYYAIGGEVA